MTTYQSLWAPVLAAALSLGGCDTSVVDIATDGGASDMAAAPIMIYQTVDMASDDTWDDSVSNLPDVCGDWPADPACVDESFGPPYAAFPLQSDPHHDPGENDQGLNRDANGYLGIDYRPLLFHWAWIADAADNNGAGSVSKIDVQTVREVARYLTVTCSSAKGGSSAQCDGTNGCCAIDDWNRYQARKAKQAVPPHQAVQLTQNSPSRTSVDLNGDLFIANRAFGGQSSVSKIANDPSECIDRNHNGRIDTSSDINGDGFIEEDCNGDGVPDDLASVKAKPCVNGLAQEFYGLDDECVLWTSNTFTSNAVVKALGLSPAGIDANNSDAWAGSSQSGDFVHIDGTTGLQNEDIQLPNGCQPNGLAVDANGIAWAPNLGAGPLCYFDTTGSGKTGVVRDPVWGPMQGDGLTLDLDQNVWVGQGVARYSPDRSNGFANLGSGFWTQITGVMGTGIAADARDGITYYVWSCTANGVLEIPASTIPAPGHNGLAAADYMVASMQWPSINIPCTAVGVDVDQNVWGVSAQAATRALVDGNGKITQPDVLGKPMGQNICAAGESCPIVGADAYSDFMSFGLRNIERPTPTYSLVIAGCVDEAGQPLPTSRDAVVWDADVPPNTSLEVHARSANASTIMDPSWNLAEFCTSSNVSPLVLQNNLVPNLADDDGFSTPADGFLDVEFIFKTQVQSATPKLKSIQVGYKCVDYL